MYTLRGVVIAAFVLIGIECFAWGLILDWGLGYLAGAGAWALAYYVYRTTA